MITSRRNETLKAIRRLRRGQGEQALLEGPLLIAEALSAGLLPATVLLTPEYAAGEAGAALTERLARPPLLVESSLLAELADADTPKGALAVVRLPRPGVAVLPRAAAGTYLFLDGVQDPGNLGAVARVAEAFGATALALGPGCAHPNHPRALRASAGSLLRLPVARAVEVAALDQRLDGLSPSWIGLASHGGEPPPEGPAAATRILVIGPERGGFSPPVDRRLDRRWTLPIEDAVESLNLAVAAGIVLWVVSRRRGSPR